MSKKTTMVRALALILTMLTCLTLVLTACGDGNKPNNGTNTGNNGTTGGSTSDPDSVTQQVKDRYGSNDFGGYEFKVLGMQSGGFWYGNFMQDTFNEIWYETDSADPLESAIYKRNRLTEELLHITITPVWDGTDSTQDMVRKAIETGDTDYDIVLTSLYEALTLAMEGYCTNLLEVETLDLSNDWWDQNMAESFTLFHSKLYTIAGHINVYDDMAVNLLMFNKDMVQTLSLSNPYDLVKENNWTLQTMTDMAKKATFDTGDGNMGPEDSWGMWIGGGAGILASGFDQPKTKPNEDGIPQLMMGDEAYVNAASKLYELVFQNDISYQGDLDTEARDAMFSDNRLLFYWIVTCQLNRYRNTDTEFGIIPMPMRDNTQTRYSGSVNQHFFSSYIIPVFNQELDRTGTILDVLGGMSTDTVYNTEFDTMLGYDSKLLRDNESKNMLDIIFSTREFDYSILDIGDVGKVYSTMDTWGSFQYESVYDTYKRGANAKLKKIITAFEALP